MAGRGPRQALGCFAQPQLPSKTGTAFAVSPEVLRDAPEFPFQRARLWLREETRHVFLTTPQKVNTDHEKGTDVIL